MRFDCANASRQSPFLRVLIAAASTTLLLACGGTGGDVPGAGGSGGSVSSSSSHTSTTGGGTPAPEVWASAVIETEPGSAPGLIEAHNDTPLFLTIQLGGSNFFQIASWSRLPYQLAVSDDISGDMRLGYHETALPNAPCVFLNDLDIVGPSAVTPGELTRVRVTGSDHETLMTEITSAPTSQPHLGLRIRHGATPLGLKHIEVEVDGQPVSFSASTAGLTEYRYFAAESVSLGAIVLYALDRWEGDLGDIEIDGSGITLVLGQPHDGSLASTELSIIPASSGIDGG